MQLILAVVFFLQLHVVYRDTDVMVLLLGNWKNICQRVWLQTGTRKRPCYIPLHLIKLPRGVRESLIPFHALTDSDATSQLDGIGKQRS